MKMKMGMDMGNCPMTKSSKQCKMAKSNKSTSMPESTANNQSGAGGGKFKTKTGVNKPMNSENPISKEY